MQLYQASLHYTLIQLGATDPLTKPLTYVEYMAGAFADCAHEESLWLISMNPNCRPIARTLLRAGPCAAGVTPTRDLFRVALQADAHAIAVVRGEPGTTVILTPTDLRRAQEFAAAGSSLNIRCVDYLVISTQENLRRPVYASWRHGVD
jgi:DNA repair protein RadC